MDENYKLVYDKIIKRHQSSNKLHTGRLIFYIFDYVLLIWNIVMHWKNGAYLGFGLTILIHFISAFIVSKIYHHNETEIDENNPVLNEKPWKFFRMVSKFLGISPLFRIVANWRYHSEQYYSVRSNQRLRNPIDREEIESAVEIRKTLLVNAYFDTLHVTFKTIPQCLLQIFMALDWNRPFRFCGLTDLTRFGTMIGSLFVAAKASASYTTELSEYLTLLHIQDNLLHNQMPKDLTPPLTHFWWVSLLRNILLVGSRVYALAFIMKSCEYPVFVAIMALLIVFLLYILWIRVETESRPIYENPPRGILTIHSEIIDRFMSIFLSHVIPPRLSAVYLHELTFGVVYIAIHAGNTWLTQSDTTSARSYNTTFFNNEIFRCNFSTFSDSSNKFARGIHLVLNEYKDDVPMFKEVFTNLWAIILLTISLFTSIIYVRYVNHFGLQNVTFPFGLTVKYWKDFLNRDWESLGKTEAIKLILLGTAGTGDLEIWDYKFPNNLNQLKELVRIVMEKKTTVEHFRGHSQNCSCDNQSCDEEIRNLIEYLSDIEETDSICRYFYEHFQFCMNEMTSHRIAQTKNIICDKNCCSEVFFKNLKYFGLRIND